MAWAAMKEETERQAIFREEDGGRRGWRMKKGKTGKRKKDRGKEGEGRGRGREPVAFSRESDR